MKFKLQQKTKQLPSHSNLSKFSTTIVVYHMPSMYKKIVDKTSQSLKLKLLSTQKEARKQQNKLIYPQTLNPTLVLKCDCPLHDMYFEFQVFKHFVVASLFHKAFNKPKSP
jgi:hypothetical protein